MHNRPVPSFQSHHAPLPARHEPTAGHPNGRLVWIYGMLLVVFLTIAGRLAWIQVRLPGAYIQSFEWTRTDFEVIPGRDGRILTDRLVLATDVERYNVEAHYRWLESPPDPDWLTRRARTRLDQRARSGSRELEQSRQAVLQRRQQMWDRFLTIARLDRDQVDTTRRRIQRRVERIAGSVNRRHQERMRESDDTPTPSDLPEIAERIRQQVTSPPRRKSQAPIVVREELDYHAIAGDVSLEVAAEIQSHPELYPGLRVRVATERRYPARTLAAHLVGTRTRAREDELPNEDPIAAAEHRIGRTGIERAWDGRLRGIDGLRRIIRNRRGEVIRTETVREPVSGQDVVLTLETDLQRRAEQLLDAALEPPPPADPAEVRPVPRGGCIIVLNAHSGDILAMAAAPRYDLNLLVEADSETWQTTLSDPRHPLFPRATQMTIPPGSVFKILSAVALIESGRIDPDELMRCQGYLDRPDRHRCLIYRRYGVGHGDTDLNRALAQSCNVYFFTAARMLGPNPLVQWARRFEFGQPSGVDLPFEKPGNLPDPATRSSEHRHWYPGDTLSLAIGQSRLTVTPLQVARMMCVIANGGYLVTPRLADRDSSLRSGERHTASWPARPRRAVRGLSEYAIERIRDGLSSAVQDPGGTGYETVRLDGVPIAGKTGTAENGGNRPDHAWFAGYVPADRPRYALVVVLEHGGSGGRVAGPLARNIVRSMVDLDLLPSDQVARN